MGDLTRCHSHVRITKSTITSCQGGQFNKGPANWGNSLESRSSICEHCIVWQIESMHGRIEEAGFVVLCACRNVFVCHQWSARERSRHNAHAHLVVREMSTAGQEYPVVKGAWHRGRHMRHFPVVRVVGTLGRRESIMRLHTWRFAGYR